MCQTEALQQKSGCCFKGQEGPNNDDGGDWRGEILSEIWVKKMLEMFLGGDMEIFTDGST